MPLKDVLLAPGPSQVPERVRLALAEQSWYHRSSRFKTLFKECRDRLGRVFETTTSDVLIFAGSGTAAMEASIVNAIPKGRKALVVSGGKWGERLVSITKAFDIPTEVIKIEYGKVPQPAQIAEALKKDPSIAAVYVHLCETSTGALNQVRDLSDAAHSRGVFCLVDSVSALGGAELRFDDWKLDYVLTGSQKALALPPGLAFAAASDEFVALAGTAEGRGVYFDIVEMDRFAQSNQVPATPAFSLLYALDVQLEAMQREGMGNRWRRHSEMAAATELWLEHVQTQSGSTLENIVAVGSRSPTVSTIRLPEGVGGKTFVRKVLARGIQVGGGYGKLGDTTFRIGHMGDHSVSTLRACFDACEGALRD